MWDFTYVFPSLLILSIIMGYYFVLPRIPIRMNHTFIHLIGVEFVVMVFDIVSSWADMNYQDFSAWTLYVVNDIYFIGFFARAFFFFAFTVTVLHIPYLNDRRIYFVSMLPFFVVTILVLTTPITKLFYYIDETGYHSAPLYFGLYVEFWIYLGLSLLAVLANIDKLKGKKEVWSVLWLNSILLIGTIFRLLFPKYLLMDTFCLLSLLIAYLSFMNPEFYLEGKTWIFNSKALKEYLEEINGHKKYKIFVFVIHHYKDVRELYGMRQMDQGICLIGDYIKKTFTNYKPFYTRNGRFCMITDYLADTGRIRDILQERFNSPWIADNTELYLDIGCAIFNTHNKKIEYDTMTSLLQNTFNEAERVNKEGLIVIDDTFAEKAKRDMDVKKSIEYAIDHDTCEVFLQPIIDSSTGKLCGAEALARIKDSEGNYISPALFIPVAEHNGRINEIGEQMFIKLCRFIRENKVKELGLKWINFNLSPVQLMKVDLAQSLMKYVREYNIEPKFIHLEITEEAMVDDQLLVNQTNQIKDLGFHFVLDDYGKGYSNLTRLKRCPFINIKLDMSIVWDYCRKPDVLLPNMVKTFTNMGFGITAEGIETEEMAQIMTDIGCKYLQGYYFSKPLPLDEFVKKYSQA